MNLPKLTIKNPYKKRPLNEHVMLNKNELTIPGIKALTHPASMAVKVHIANGYFGGNDDKGWGKL